MPLRLVLTALAALAAACSLSVSAEAGRSTCAVSGGYSYAGFLSPTAAYGVSGRLTLVAQPQVDDGHVAAWLGVGGSGMGPGGTDAWVQVGIAGFPDGHSELYYEFQRPGEKEPKYVTVGTASTGESHDVSVSERHPNVWRVEVDGTTVGPAITLPGSHGTWRPMATGESWDGGVAACNRFSYAFSNLSTATKSGGGWAPFALKSPIQDPGYRVAQRATGFAALAA